MKTPTLNELQEWALANGCGGLTDDEVYQEWLLSHYTKCEDHYQ